MSQFFCNIDINFSKDIPNTDNLLLQDQYPINSKKACSNFRTIRAGHIEKALGKLKTSAGFGADGIASQFVKIGFAVIANHFAIFLMFLKRQVDSLILGKLPSCSPSLKVV